MTSIIERVVREALANLRDHQTLLTGAPADDVLLLGNPSCWPGAMRLVLALDYGQRAEVALDLVMRAIDEDASMRTLLVASGLHRSPDIVAALANALCPTESPTKDHPTCL